MKMYNDILLKDAFRIQNKMNVFLHMNSNSIQRVLRDVEIADLEKALLVAVDDVRNAIFGNCSKRLTEIIQAEMANVSYISYQEAEQRINKILLIIDKLNEAGEIELY